jgi:hypothetical protein
MMPPGGVNCEEGTGVTAAVAEDEVDGKTPGEGLRVFAVLAEDGVPGEGVVRPEEGAPIGMAFVVDE